MRQRHILNSNSKYNPQKRLLVPMDCNCTQRVADILSLSMTLVLPLQGLQHTSLK